MRYSSFWWQDIFPLATLHKVVEWTFLKGGALCYKFLTWRASTMAPVCVPVFMETLASGICELSWNLHIDANLKFKNCIDFNKNIKIISQRLRGGGVYFKIWMLFKKHSLPKEGRVKDTLAPFSHALIKWSVSCGSENSLVDSGFQIPLSD